MPDELPMAYTAIRDAERSDGVFDVFMEERSRLIQDLFNARDYKDTAPATAYPDPVLPLAVGFTVGMPEVLGGTVAGLGAPIRWLDSALNGRDETWLSSLAKVLESGGNWVSEHPWIGPESVARFRATVAYPVIDDDGRPLWQGWLTDREGKLDVHRRFWEAARSLSGNIGESALPFLAELGLTRGAGTLMRFGSMGKTALSIGAMSAVQADQGYKQLIAAGVDEDVAAREATKYGAITGPIEYAEAVLGSRLFKTAIGKMGYADAFEWTAQKILGDSGKFALVRGAAVEGTEEVVQGVLMNPAKASAYAAMRERNPSWTPNTDDWYTLNDAYNDFAIGAGAAGFLRVSGRLLGAALNNKRTAAAKTRGEATDGPMTPEQKSVYRAVQSTDQTWAPRTVIEGQFRAILDGLQSAQAVAAGLDITADDLLKAAYLYNEDQEAGIRYYEDRVNVTALTDRDTRSGKDIAERVQQRNARVAADDSTATAFLNESSALDRPVRMPVVAVPSTKAEAVFRSMDKAKIEDDDAMGTYLGLPQRVDGVLLPAEKQAIGELRKVLKEIWEVAPNAKVVQTLSPVAAYTPAEATRTGLSRAGMALDAQGRVLARVSAKVGFVDGVPTVRLPRGFTLKDIRQAQVQLLGAANGAAVKNGDWNKNATRLSDVLREWWGRVGKGVQRTAMATPMPDVGKIEDAGKRAQALSAMADELLGFATEGKLTEDQAALEGLRAQVQVADLPMQAAMEAASRLNAIATKFAGTSEAAKARVVLENSRKSLLSAFASMVARPETAPAVALPTEEAPDLETILTEQAKGAPWVGEMMSRLTGQEAKTPVKDELLPESEWDRADAETEDETVAAEPQKVAEELKKALAQEVSSTPVVGLAWETGVERPFVFDPNSTKNEGRFRLRSPDAIAPGTYFRRKSSTPGVSYVMGKDKTTGQEVIQAIRFDKRQMSEIQAANWYIDNAERLGRTSIEPPRAQQAVLPAITPAELDTRIAQVAKQMNGTVTVQPDGSRILRVGNYELTLTTPQEVTDAEGKRVAGVVVRIRDTAMGGKLVSWQIELGPEANVTTAAHEVVHAGLDLLEQEERTILAAEMGRTTLDERTEETVTQDLAEAIVTGKEYGTVGSKARMVWTKIKTILDALFHLRFGDAWTALKALPMELRADAVKGMVMRGEVFTREGTQRQGTPEERESRSTIQSVVKGLGGTITKAADFDLYGDYRIELNGKVLYFSAKHNPEAGRWWYSEKMRDPDMKLAGEYPFEFIPKIFGLASEPRYQRLSETEGFIRGEQKGRVAMLPYIRDLANQVKKLSTQLADSEEALTTEREITRLIQAKTRFETGRIEQFEEASDAGRTVLEDMSVEAAPKVAQRLAAGKTAATNILSALGVDMVNTEESAMLGTLSLPQTRQLLRGLLNGVNRALLKHYIRQAKEQQAVATKFQPRGKKMSVWTEDYKGENLGDSYAALREQWVLNRKNKDWRAWKDIATELERIVALNKASLAEAAKEQRDAAKEASKQMGAEMVAAADKSPSIKQPWHRTFVDALGAPISVLGRMGPLVKDIFYTRIMKAWDRSTALMRAMSDQFTNALGEMQRDPNAAALDKREFIIHGKPIGVTANEVAHVVGMLTDASTLRAFGRGEPIILEQQAGNGMPWINSSLRNLFVPQGAKDLLFVNQDTGEEVRATYTPGPEWVSPETLKGEREFLAQVTPMDLQVAAAQKQAMVVGMRALNETESRAHNRIVFPEEAFPHEDAALSASLGLPANTVWGYTPRFRDVAMAQKKYANGDEYRALQAGVLEELGVGQERARSKNPLLIRDITVVVDQRAGQIARMAEMQEDVRRALDFLGNQEEQEGGFAQQLAVIYGPDASNAILEYLNRASGFGQANTVFAKWDKMVRSMLVARLAGRLTSYLQNRYTSIIAARQWMVQDAEETGVGKAAVSSFIKRAALVVSTKPGSEGAIARDKLVNDPNTGYFWKRWMKDMLRTYLQADMDEPLIGRKWDLISIQAQTWFMKWFSYAEERVAVSAFLAYKDAGLTDSQATAKVEAMFRATQNTSDPLEESAALRRVKQSNWGWMFPYISQTMALRNLLVDAALGLKDPTKRAASSQMLVAIGMTLIASETFRTLVRKAIRPEPEDEEEKRRRKFVMNTMRDAMGTIAPGVGDNVFALLFTDTVDKTLLADMVGDMAALPRLSIKAVMADEIDREIEPKQWAEALAKSVQAAGSAAGLPISGGVDQLTQFIIERTIPPTQQEVGKRRAVSVMDSLSENPTRAEFDRAVRLAYRDAVEKGDVDRKKTSYREFRNRFRTRVADNYGKATAEKWGYKFEERKG